MPEIVFEILVRGNVAAAALQAHFHVELAAFAHGRDVDFLIEHFHIAVGFDHAAGDDSRLIGAQVDRLRTITRKLERNLLHVEDDVGRIFYDSGDRLEFVQHAFDLYRGNGRAFDRTQHHAPQRVADGGAESALKRLRPEHSVFIGKRVDIARQSFRFLKTSPKHLCFSSRPCGSILLLSGPAQVQIQERLIWHESLTKKSVVSRSWRSRVSVCQRISSCTRRRDKYDLLDVFTSIQLDNQLLIYRQLNIFAFRQRDHAAFVVLAIDFQPHRRRLMTGKVSCDFENRNLAAVLANRNLFADGDFVGRNVHLLAVHLHVSVTHQLARLAAGNAEAQAIDHVVETPFELIPAASRPSRPWTATAFSK